MKKMFLWVCLFCFFCFTGIVHATPPLNISLSYDEQQRVLHVEVDHVSNNLSKHYIHKILFFQNEKLVKELFFPKQLNGKGVTQDILLSAVEGDLIKVQASCVIQGNAEAELVISPQLKEDE